MYKSTLDVIGDWFGMLIYISGVYLVIHTIWADFGSQYGKLALGIAMYYWGRNFLKNSKS